MMGRSPSSAESSAWSCDENSSLLKKGPWTPEEDQKLVEYIERYGHGSWRALPKLAGLNRCGKSCRLRWANYLRPDIKRGNFSHEEEKTIINLHALLRNKWSAIASNPPGRTDNEIKNFWNTHLKKRLLQTGIDPVTHRPITTSTTIDHHQYDLMMINHILSSLGPQLLASSSSLANNLMNLWDVNNNNISALLRLHYSDAKIQVLQSILQQYLSSSTTSRPNLEAAVNLLGSPDHHLELYDADDQDSSLMNINHFSHLQACCGINGATVHNIPNITKAPHHDHDHHQRPHNASGASDKLYQTPFSAAGSNIVFAGTTTTNNIDHIINQQLAAGSSSSSYATPIILRDHQLPLLVNSAASLPESTSATNQTMEEINKINIYSTNNPNIHDHIISNQSSTSTSTFEAWGDLMNHDEATNHSYWKNIITDLASSQTSSPISYNYER